MSSSDIKKGKIGTGRPTLKTIAKLSGLAVPTVSRALHDAPDIGSSTKEKVRRIAQEIGYRPDRAGVRLRTGKTNVLALILSTEHDMMNHTARLIASIAAGTRDTPYNMIVTPFFPDQDPMDPVRHIIETGSADGIILNQTLPLDPRIEYLMKIGFPFATHGRTDWSDQHPFYDFDNKVFGKLSIQKLAWRGRSHIAMLAPRPDQYYAIGMIEGATAEAARLGVEFTVLDNATTDDSPQEVTQAMEQRLDDLPKLDGLISGATNAAMALVTAVENKGRHIGQDIDLITKEALPFLHRFRRDILAVSEDVTKAGAFLSTALMQAIDHPDKPPMQFLEVPTEKDVY